METTAPPPLIQDPDSPIQKTVTIKTPGNKSITFSLNKVLAAVGLILTISIIILGGVWIWLQMQTKGTTTADQGSVHVSTSSAKVASKSATPSAY